MLKIFFHKLKRKQQIKKRRKRKEKEEKRSVRRKNKAMEITGSVEALLNGKVVKKEGDLGQVNSPEELAAKAIQILQDTHLIESQMNLSQFKRITCKIK